MTKKLSLLIFLLLLQIIPVFSIENTENTGTFEEPPSVGDYNYTYYSNISNSSISDSNTFSCYDSDRYDYNSKGYLLINNIDTYFDSCVDPETLNELFCNPNSTQGFNGMGYNCENSCFDGACEDPLQECTRKYQELEVTYSKLIMDFNRTQSSLVNLERDYSNLIMDFNRTQSSLVNLEMKYSDLNTKYSKALTCNKFNENQCLSINNYCKTNYDIKKARWGKGQTKVFTSCSNLS